MENTGRPTDVWVHGRKFSPYIDRHAIEARVEEMGKEITRVYAGRQPFFLGVLNGAFVFISDLVRACHLECEVGFIRLSSYSGMQSSGEVRTLLGVNAEIKDRPVIVVEDIIDSGRTMTLLLQDLQQYALEVPLDVRFVGFEIPNTFVLGYGLDYDGIGRNLPEIYQLNEE
jgi:hypoxanthine phosphoribosyltransferase